MKTSSEDEDERRLQDVFMKTNVWWVDFYVIMKIEEERIKVGLSPSQKVVLLA